MNGFVNFSDFLKGKGIDIVKARGGSRKIYEDDFDPYGDNNDDEEAKNSGELDNPEFEGGIDPDFPENDEEPDENDVPDIKPASENDGSVLKASTPEKMLNLLKDNGLLISKDDEKSFINKKEIEASYNEIFFNVILTQIKGNNFSVTLPKNVVFRKGNITAREIDDIISKLLKKKVIIDEEKMVDFRNGEPIIATINNKEFTIFLDKKRNGDYLVHIPEKIK